MVNDTTKNQEEYFKSISHHPINNAFHQLKFGSNNQNNIQFVTPGETLHMAQLGCAKRAVESFNYLLKGRVLQSDMVSIGQYYGALLSRQSERNFPRTKFGTSILSVTKQEGGDHAGILISIFISIVSKVGTELLLNKGKIQTEFIEKQARCI